MSMRSWLTCTGGVCASLPTEENFYMEEDNVGELCSKYIVRNPAYIG